MGAYQYQHGFSEMHSDEMYDVESRELKANKMLAVLEDYYSGKLDKLKVLDVGCSSGIIDNYISNSFGYLIGTDIDKPAVAYAQKKYSSEKLSFSIQDSMDLAFSDGSFDIVICSQIYEHVPDSSKLMSEIYRIVKKGGICFFFAGNRLNLIEPHYNLPLLSVLPKAMAHLYLRIAKKGDFYYENHLTYWGLKKLVSAFELIDYTGSVIREPGSFYLGDKLKKGSLKHKAIMFFFNFFYWLCPSYIWLLRKQ